MRAQEGLEEGEGCWGEKGDEPSRFVEHRVLCDKPYVFRAVLVKVGQQVEEGEEVVLEAVAGKENKRSTR